VWDSDSSVVGWWKVMGLSGKFLPERRHVVVDSVDIHYLERAASGGESAPPILLLHALLATAESLTELIAGLPTDRRVVAIDLLFMHPVTQRNDKRKKLDVHQANLAGLVHGFMESVGLVRPVVIGHSHGGVLALRLAATERDLLRGLVLMCPAHPFGGYRSHVVNFYLRQPGRFLALSIPLAPSWMILRAYNEAAGPKSRIRMRHLRPHLRVLRNRNTLRRVLQMLATWDADMDELRQALAERAIEMPTLLIWGEDDPVVPIASAAELGEHLDDSEMVTLPGMGHLLVEEAPEECGRLIREWLGRVDARS
jgi:pimeloyl-ACP methyl ester carboxylesterase